MSLARGAFRAFLLLVAPSAYGGAAHALPSGPAHEVRPGYLELRETTPGVFRVLWEKPAMAAPTSTQERAHTSPIWYTPGN